MANFTEWSSMIQIVAAPPFRQMSLETYLPHKLPSRAVVATPNPAAGRVDMEMSYKMALGGDQQAAMVAP